jgi:hypothetical protein
LKTYFIPNASFQQAHVPLSLHASTLFSNVVMVAKHVPVKVELMVMISQLVAMVVLQLVRFKPKEPALEADLKGTKVSDNKNTSTINQIYKQLVILASKFIFR